MNNCIKILVENWIVGGVLFQRTGPLKYCIRIEELVFIVLVNEMLNHRDVDVTMSEK